MLISGIDTERREFRLHFHVLWHVIQMSCTGSALMELQGCEQGKVQLKKQSITGILPNRLDLL